jgi:CBS domain containing-hemolysin-like protein
MNLLLILLLMILLSAFFSGMEIAYVSANKLRLELDKKSDPLVSGILGFVTRDSGKYIATMLIGNNIALVIYSIAFAALLRPLIDPYIASQFLILLIQTIVSTLVILVLAEFLPKTLFRIFPNALLNIFSVPLAFFYILFYPITLFSLGITNFLIKNVFKTKVNEGNDNPVFSRVDLDYFINESRTEFDQTEEEEEHEVKLFRNALDFSKVRIKEIMVPRTEMEALECTVSIEEMRTKFIETGFSRILIYEDNIDNIIGYVHSSIIFENPTSIKPFLKEILIVPETMPANKLLSIFIKDHRSVAIVVDEFGGTAGMVTSEDILEEIFGEIEDEHDTSDFIEKKINDNEYIFSGRFEIDFLNEKYKLHLPDTEDFETLAGYILSHYKSIPKIQTLINIGPFQFKILKATNTKIELVHLKIREK